MKGEMSDIHAGDDAVGILREAVVAAQQRVLRRGNGVENVFETLAYLLVDLTPVLNELKLVVIDQPTGPVAAVLEHVRFAFGYAKDGATESAAERVLAAAAVASRLGGAAGSGSSSRAEGQ